MKITLVGINYAPEPTSVGPYATGAAEGLHRVGEDVQVITGYPHYPQWRIADGYTGLTRRERINQIPVLRLRHPVPRSGSVIGRSLMEVVFGLRAALRRWHHTDVVMSITPPLLSTALVVARARLTRVPAVVWVQDIYTLGATQTGKATGLAGVIQRVEAWTLRSATRVVVIHDRFAEFITTRLGVDPERVDVVRNWSHVAENTTRSAAARQRLGWSSDEVIVLHAGNMGSKQHLENVVRASALAAQRGSAVRFVLLGDGHRRSALEAMGSNPNLTFIDPLPEDAFAEALANADALLVNELPTMTEMSVPSKLTTYFSSGLPVLAAVSADSVTAAELEAAGAGMVVGADDPAALLAGAEALAADHELGRKLGESGLAYRRAVLSEPAAIAGLQRSLAAALKA